MPDANRISISITPEDFEAGEAGLTAMEEKFNPYLKDLDKGERRGLPKMGDKTVNFVGKSLGYAEANPNLVPPYLDKAEFRKDFVAVQTLTTILRRVEKFHDMLDDTILLCGSEAYKAALTFYKAVQNAMKSGVPGAEVIYNDLKVQFEKTKEKSE